jgi:hypothetical protein
MNSSSKRPALQINPGTFPEVVYCGRSNIRIYKTWENGTPVVETFPGGRCNKASEIRVFPPIRKIDHFTVLQREIISYVRGLFPCKYWDCPTALHRSNDGDSRRKRVEIRRALDVLIGARVIIRIRSDKHHINNVVFNYDGFRRHPELD